VYLVCFSFCNLMKSTW